TNIPFKNPANRPVIKEIIRARVGFPVEADKLVNIHAENPNMEGKERSISLQIITGVKATARIAIKGMMDIKE
ncbi:hypothetical protein LCGC14_2231620, partial [marine sediment metagenome]